ncbi:MAG: hypothetical protein HZA53_05885, partial [Planctomycetes bacterium]|nr:hypothetical protein [Planctomycetota bacterium]
ERRIRDEDGARIRSLGLESYGVPSVGHTFLVRSIPGDPRRPDLIVAFRDVAEDAYGHTIVWRILQRVSLEYGERR